MKLFSCILLLCLQFSCQKKIANSEYYKIAIKGLTYDEPYFNYQLIKLKELKNIDSIKTESVTFHLTKKNTFSFRNLKTKKIVIYQFTSKTNYDYLTCDSLWRIEKIHHRRY